MRSKVIRAKIIFILIVSFLIIPCRFAYSSTFLKVRPKKMIVGIINADDYENGYKEKTRANEIEVKDTDNDWKLMLKTNDSDMGVIAGYAKPISDFLWKATGEYATQITYTEITNYDVEVARGPKGDDRLDVYTDFKILLAWQNDSPGYYNITLVYTLTTQ